MSGGGREGSPHTSPQINQRVLNPNIVIPTMQNNNRSIDFKTNFEIATAVWGKC